MTEPHYVSSMHFSSYLTCLADYREYAANKIADVEPNASSSYPVFAIEDVHLASGCLQKSLRRGDRAFAQASAHYLAEHDPERLWRRLTVCAFEDVGVADLGAVAQVVAAAMSSAFRIRLGEPRTRVYLVDLLTVAAKHRLLDDLYMLGERYAQGRIERSELRTASLESQIESLVHEASWLIRRCERPIAQRGIRGVVLSACEAALERMKTKGRASPALVELSAAGIQRSRCLLPLLLPLVFASQDESVGLLVSEPLPPAPLIEGVPAYCIDGYTRPGRLVLARLGREDGGLRSILKPLPSSTHPSVLHHLLFCVEGQCCSPRLADPLAEALRLRAATLGTALKAEKMPDAIATMCDALPRVHALRAEVLAEHKRDLETRL